MTTSNEILKLLKARKKFVFGGELEMSIANRTFAKPSTVSRILRSMAEEGLIYRDYENVGRKNLRVVKYKIK